MEAQGYTIEINILYQDKNSTILLAKNGRMSAGKNSKHIKNRFFLITDKVSQGDLKIRHKGTDDMWDDMNTKPTQGNLFRTQLSEVMGVSVEYDDYVERRNTHPLILLPQEAERISTTDREILEKIRVFKSVVAEKLAKRGRADSISHGAKPAVKLRSVLDEYKYSQGAGTRWKNGGARFPNLYKVLLVGSN